MSSDEELIERNILKLAGDGRRILEGHQTSTTRLGLRHYVLGHALMVHAFGRFRIFITRLEATTFECLLPEHAQTEGCESERALKQKVRRFYPRVRASDWITYVRFEIEETDPIPARRRGFGWGRRG